MMDVEKLEQAMDVQLNYLTEGELNGEELINHTNALGAMSSMMDNAVKTSTEVKKTEEELKLKKRESAAKIGIGIAELGVSIWSFKKLLKFEELGSIGSRTFPSVWKGVAKIGNLLRAL